MNTIRYIVRKKQNKTAMKRLPENSQKQVKKHQKRNKNPKKSIQQTRLSSTTTTATTTAILSCI